MAERDRVIKSGQLTVPRLLFLLAVGIFVVGTVALGGVYLTIGYWALTLAICGLLYLIAIDWGIHMDKVDLSGQPVQAAQAAPLPSGAEPRAAAADSRVKKRASRPKRRR